MPELPEVETTLRGVEPFLKDAEISHVTVRNFSLRWPIDPHLAEILTGQTINLLYRRAKYLLLECDTGTLIIHLGMSGRLRILTVSENIAPEKHDHFDMAVENDHLLRYTDPRRFGAILWTEAPIENHRLFNHLGPEPLTEAFDAAYLLAKSQNRRCSAKTLLMDGKVVVGIGNIYANEALFMAGIHPRKSANQLTIKNCDKLVTAIKAILTQAIKAGGTTLKDFRKSDGKPGYFAQQLNIYGRQGEVCVHCGNEIEHYKEAQRATFYCPKCQKLK
jgi:formamidopyrimidine-DNA glycosylase